MDSNSSTLKCSRLFNFSKSYEEIGESTCSSTHDSGGAVGMPYIGTKCRNFSISSADQFRDRPTLNAILMSHRLKRSKSKSNLISVPR